jgi:ankyrin repeat protein
MSKHELCAALRLQCNGHEQVVRLLLENGADVNARNAKSALRAAVCFAKRARAGCPAAAREWS